MELDELHIFDPSLGPVGLSITPCRKQGNTGEHSLDPVGMLVQRIHPITFHIRGRFGDQVAEVVLRDEVEDEPMLDDLYILLDAYCRQQGAFYFFARYVLMVQDAEFGMPSLLTQLEIPVRVLVEAGAPADHFLDPFGTFLYDDLHRPRIAKAIASNKGVPDMLLIAVMLKIRYACDAALRIFRIGLIHLCLGNDQHFFFRMALGYFQGVAQASNAGADNQEICLYHKREIDAKLAQVSHFPSNKNCISWGIIPHHETVNFPVPGLFFFSPVTTAIMDPARPYLQKLLCIPSIRSGWSWPTGTVMLPVK